MPMPQALAHTEGVPESSSASTNTQGVFVDFKSQLCKEEQPYYFLPVPNSEADLVLVTH